MIEGAVASLPARGSPPEFQQKINSLSASAKFFLQYKNVTKARI
jgi:hypothetical protein